MLANDSPAPQPHQQDYLWWSLWFCSPANPSTTTAASSSTSTTTSGGRFSVGDLAAKILRYVCICMQGDLTEVMTESLPTYLPYPTYLSYPIYLSILPTLPTYLPTHLPTHLSYVLIYPTLP